MNIERVPIAQVVPWPKNPRGIKTKDFERLKKQIKKLGEYKPLVAYRENGHYVVLGGNMRLRAYQELGIQEVEVSIIKPKSEAQKIEYALSDNDRVGYYEEEALAELIYPHIKDIDLGEYKVDLGEAIDLKQVVERYGPDIDDGADEIPEVDDTPALTKTGDLLTLGRHRVMCGDSTKAEDVARLMRGEKAGLSVTSPPYFNQRPEYSTFKTYAEFNNFLSEVVKRIIGVAGNPFILAWNTGDNQADCLPMIADQTAMIHGLGLTYLDTIIWKKAGAVYSIPRSAHIRTHQYYYPALAWEPIVIFRKGELMPKFDAADVERVSKFGINIWEMNQVVGSQQDKIGHPAIYPLELPTRVMMAYSTSGANVLDPFLGSGTTLIAAEKLNRTCYGMEIDPKYCDVIIKRYCDYAHVDEAVVRATREGA
jgi:DNA modification methylase